MVVESAGMGRDEEACFLPSAFEPVKRSSAGGADGAGSRARVGETGVAYLLLLPAILAISTIETSSASAMSLSVAQVGLALPVSIADNVRPVSPALAATASWV